METRLLIIALLLAWYAVVRKGVIWTLTEGQKRPLDRVERYVLASALAIPATFFTIFIPSLILGFIVYGGR